MSEYFNDDLDWEELSIDQECLNKEPIAGSSKDIDYIDFKIDSDDNTALAAVHLLYKFYYIYTEQQGLQIGSFYDPFENNRVTSDLIQCRQSLLSLKDVPITSFLQSLKENGNDISVLQSTLLAAIVGPQITGELMEKKFSHAFMKDVIWVCITIVLYYYHQTETELLFKATVVSLHDILMDVVKVGANDALQLQTNFLLRVLHYVAMQPPQCAVLKLVSDALLHPVHLIPAIASNAVTISSSGQLQMRTILKTLCDISKKSTYINLNPVFAIATSVPSVMNTLLNLQKGLSVLNLTITGSKRPLSVTRNEIVEDLQKPQEKMSFRLGKEKLTQILEVTNFNNISYSNKPIVTDKSRTSEFLKLFIEYNITSMRHFHYIISIDKTLKDLFLKIPYNLTTHILNKGLTICQSQFKVTTLTEKMLTLPNDDDIEIKALTGLVLKFLSDISYQNNKDSYALLDNIFDVLHMRDFKRITLCLIGVSNSGKSFLTQLFTSAFDEHEIGNMIAPHKDTLSDFWLSNCVYSSIKQCEEFFIPTVGVAAEFKKLLEGNPSLVANVKYKENLPVPKTPVFITMNGQNITDLTKFCSNEFCAIANRCYIFVMNQPISSHRISNHLSAISQHKLKIMKRLFDLDQRRFINRCKHISELGDLNDLLEEEENAAAAV